jgi:sugar phosphate isomerase/epimerase
MPPVSKVRFMQFGICTSIENSPLAKSQGWDYIEAGATSLLQGELPDEQWQGRGLAASSALPVQAVNLLVPGSMKITGPRADLDRVLKPYLDRIMDRARQLGIETLVFGSGGARNIPDGFDPARAREQLIEFARAAADAAGRAGRMVVIEPLNRTECNLVNTVAEAMQMVREINHPNLRCLVDSYHLWLEDEPLEHVEDAIDSIAHVHVADRDGRVAPGLSKTSDYRRLFRILKRHGYAGRISVEASNFDIATNGSSVLTFLRSQWSGAGD